RYDHARPVVGLAPTLTVQSDSQPLSLEFDVADPREPLHILGQAARGRFTVRVLGRRSERAREFPVMGRTVVVDDSVYALYLFAAALLLCPLPALGQRPKGLSLADAIALARDSNPAYRQALHDRAPAVWGVRNAWATFLPSLSASAGGGYAGPGEQTFLPASFSQNVATWSSSYNLGLNWQLSGTTLAQPGLRQAQLVAANA